MRRLILFFSIPVLLALVFLTGRRIESVYVREPDRTTVAGRETPSRPTVPTQRNRERVHASPTLRPAVPQQHVQVGRFRSEERPVPFLDGAEEIASSWPAGEPTSPGWHERTRIVRSGDFKVGLLRVEDRVKLIESNAGLVAEESTTHRVMAANHVLVDAASVPFLPRDLDRWPSPRNPELFSVAVERPSDPGSLPALMALLWETLPIPPEENLIIATSALPDDPLVGQGVSWHLHNLGFLPDQVAGADVNAASGWDRREEAADTVIALIDGGVERALPELTASMHALPGETAGDGVDNDGNGFVDDVFGYDFLDSDSDPSVRGGHGTHCAALIGARGNNGTGSSGIAWRARILDCRAFRSDGFGLLSDAIDAVEYARRSGAEVINMSWGYQGPAPVLSQALRRCSDAGIVMVCASGNLGNFLPLPAPANLDLPLLVAVAATDPSDRLADFANVDPQRVAMAAPGVEVPVMPGERIHYLTGTSFSAALVSGAVALAIERFPDDDPSAIVRRLLESTAPVPGGAAALASGGRLDLGQLLAADAPPVPLDHYERRLVIEDPAGIWTGRNHGAGIEEIDLSLVPPPSRSLWFEWVASDSGPLRITLAGPAGTAPELRVFASVNGLPGAELTRRRGTGALHLEVTEGDRLLWLLDSASPISAGLEISWQLPPSNDNWSAAKPVPAGDRLLRGTTLGATDEAFEIGAPHHLFLPRSSVWFRWRAEASGRIRLLAPSTHFAFLLPVENGRPRFPDEAFELEDLHDVVAGRDYAILVVPVSPTSRGPFEIHLGDPGAISILAHPRSVAALPGDSVRLSVTAVGGQPLEYRWLKDDEPVALANQPVLRLDPLTPDMVGEYRAIVSDGVAEVVSQTATVSLSGEAPRLIGRPPVRSLTAGQSATLGAEFRSGSPVSYRWTKGGAVLPGADTNELTLADVALDDSGTYELRATNTSGSTVAVFHVEVVDTPWDGWIDRTPWRGIRSPAILTKRFDDRLEVCTGDEWLLSHDDGTSWVPLPLPPGVLAHSAAVTENGTRLFLERVSSYTSRLWSALPGGPWREFPLPEPDSHLDDFQDAIHEFDGLFWMTAGSELHWSADGEDWQRFEHPAEPGTDLNASGTLFFSNLLAIRDYPTWYLLRGHAEPPVELGDHADLAIVHDGEDVYAVMNNGWSVRRIPPSGPPVETGPDWSFPEYDVSARGSTRDGLFVGMDSSNQFLLGVPGGTIGATDHGVASWDFDGESWLVGFEDGSLWTGNDLRQLPYTGALASYPQNSGLQAGRREFSYGHLHSSDGIRWQPLGESLTGISRSSRDRFLMSLPGPWHGSAPEHYFTDSVFPFVPEIGSLPTFTELIGMTPFGAIQRRQQNGSPSFHLVPSDESSGGSTVLSLPPATSGSKPVVVFSGPDSCVIEIEVYHRVVERYQSFDGLTWTSVPFLVGKRLGFSSGTHLAIESSTLGYLSTDARSWTPVTLTGLPAVPGNIVSHRGLFVARTGEGVRVSADGVAWSDASPDFAVTSLQATDFDILAEVDGVGPPRFLQPGGDHGSGPWIDFPEIHREIEIARYQPFTYKLGVGDDDGDLAAVELRINDQLEETISSPPFDFRVIPGEAGMHALEFSARDSTGRVARATAKLTVQSTGTFDGPARPLEPEPGAKVVRLGDRLFSIIDETLRFSVDGESWSTAGLPQARVAGLQSIGGLLFAHRPFLGDTIMSQDGVTWTAIGNLYDIMFSNGRFHAELDGQQVVSTDGLEWTRSFVDDMWNTVWMDEAFGFHGGRVTLDGGRHWFWLASPWGDAKATDVPLANCVLRLASFSSVFDGEESIRLLRITPDDLVLRDAHAPLSYWSAPYLVGLEGRAYFGNAGDFLKSTADGIHFEVHATPPNQEAVELIRHGQGWIAASPDMISVSRDLRSWTVEYRRDDEDRESTASGPSYGDFFLREDGMLVGRTRDYTNTRILISPELTTTIALPTPDSLGSIGVPGDTKAVIFRDHLIVSDVSTRDWLHIRSPDTGSWSPIQLGPGAGLSVEWHPAMADRPHGPRYFDFLAADDHRFLAVAIYENDPYVVTSDDSRLFTLHDWAAPVPRQDLIKIVGGETGFVAILKGGRVMHSPDGSQWTVTTLDPDLDTTQLFRHGGRWHVVLNEGTSATNPGSDAVWSSADGLQWREDARFDYPYSGYRPTYQPFIAGGVARMSFAHFGWWRTDGSGSWATDPEFDAFLQEYQAIPVLTHGDRILLRTQYGRHRRWLDPQTMEFTGDSTLGINNQTIFGLEGRIFIHHAGNWVEWFERDPRIDRVDAPAGEYGIGDFLHVEVTAHELTPAARVRLFLTPSDADREASIELGVSAWDSGITIDAQSRAFPVPLPPAVVPGSFRVGAEIVTGDVVTRASIHNDVRVSEDRPVLIPGFRLRIDQTGEGRIESPDAGPLYAKGASVNLSAIPAHGYTFLGWGGSVATSSRSLSVEMDRDLGLSAVFTEAVAITTRVIGGGRVTGGEGRTVVSSGDPIALEASALRSWDFTGWRVNGEFVGSGPLSHVATVDTLVEALFRPDLETMRDDSFASAPLSADRSWMGDPDGDGLSTYLEILTGSSPVEPNATYERFDRVDGGIRLIFRRLEGSPELLWPEFCAALDDWSPSHPADVGSRVLARSEGFETVELTIPLTATRRFVRLAASDPPGEP